MRSGRIVLANWMIVALAGPVAFGEPGREPGNKEKIIGTWAATFGDPAGSLFEYSKDGKLKMTIYQVNLTLKYEGTYEVDGDTLKHSVKGRDGKVQTNTWKIKKLTDKVLVTESKLRDGGTVTEEYKRQ